LYRKQKNKQMQNILLVEDQPIVLKAIEYRLKKEGYQVTACDNGKDAQDYFDNNTYSAVLSDLLMPQACGLELLVHIRSKKNGDTPVVILSEISLDDKSQEAMSIGANHYMSKPFDMDELVQTIKFFSKF
jgi:DNA-binding response OmpR family regulator